MPFEYLEWVIKLAHLPFEIYLILASIYVLVPAVLYPFFAAKIRAFQDQPILDGKNLTPFLIVTPAHNEQAAISKLCESVEHLDYPKHLFEHYVIADNCTDDTAQHANATGASVWERTSSAPSDKTQALRYASKKLLAQAEALPNTHIIVIDADSELPQNFLLQLNTVVCKEKAGAYQTYRSVANPTKSTLSAMDAAAEELRQVVNLGVKHFMGFDAHLHGNGTCFRADLFHQCASGRQEPFADDKAWKATLTELNEEVKWAGNACVHYAAVTKGDKFQNQRKRWITGQIEMIRTYSMRMLWIGLSRPSASAIEFSLSMLQLPRAILLVAAAYFFALSAFSTAITWLPVGVYAFLLVSLFGYGFLGYFLRGLPVSLGQVLHTGFNAISGVASSTLKVIFGKKTSSWAALRK